MTRRLSLLLAVPLAGGCGVDVSGRGGDCPCPLDFSSHPRHAALQAVLDERVGRGLPGLAVAVRTPEGPWAGAAGFARLETAEPMTPCHVHHLASVAKTWHAAVVFSLREDGLLDLDDRAVAYLDAGVLARVPNGDRVTIRQLMNHTSGIPDFNADVGYITGEFNHPWREDTPEALLDAVRGKPALGEPGEVYRYADANYVILALLIDAVAGDATRALHERILAPLGLEATVRYERGAPEPTCIVDTYWEIGGGRLENVSDLSAEYAIHDVGADGIAASPLDTLAFVEAFVRGDLLTPRAREEATTWAPASLRDDGYGYGLGVARVRRSTGQLYGHTGGGVGTGAVARAAPDAEITFVAATNLGLFLGGPAAAAFDETLWDDLAVAAALATDRTARGTTR